MYWNWNEKHLLLQIKYIFLITTGILKIMHVISHALISTCCNNLPFLLSEVFLDICRWSFIIVPPPYICFPRWWPDSIFSTVHLGWPELFAGTWFSHPISSGRDTEPGYRTAEPNIFTTQHWAPLSLSLSLLDMPQSHILQCRYPRQTAIVLSPENLFSALRFICERHNRRQKKIPVYFIINFFLLLLNIICYKYFKLFGMLYLLLFVTNNNGCNSIY